MSKGRFCLQSMCKLACMCVHKCLRLHNCAFVFVSLCLSLDRLCASSCVIKHGGVSRYAHYLALSSVSLTALRHYPSPHRLYEYLISPQSSLLSLFAPPFYSLAFLLSPVIPFCHCCTHLSVCVSLWNSCKSFLPLTLYLPLPVCLFLYLFQQIICSSLPWGRKLLLHILPLNAQSLFLI